MTGHLLTDLPRLELPLEQGALIDEVTNVFTMARTALVLLGDGTGNADGFRGTAEMLEVIAKATSPERECSYQSLAEFAQAWRISTSAVERRTLP